jgi:hypothetical protein
VVLHIRPIMRSEVLCGAAWLRAGNSAGLAVIALRIIPRVRGCDASLVARRRRSVSATR